MIHDLPHFVLPRSKPECGEAHGEIVGHIYRDAQEVDVGDVVPGCGRAQVRHLDPPESGWPWVTMPTLHGCEQG